MRPALFLLVELLHNNAFESGRAKQRRAAQRGRWAHPEHVYDARYEALDEGWSQNMRAISVMKFGAVIDVSHASNNPGGYTVRRPSFPWRLRNCTR